MIKNYKPATYETIKEYYLVFDDGHHNGFAFPCDKNGTLLRNVPDEAIKNYQNCLKTPEKFIRFNKIIIEEYRYRNNASGTCSCGNKVELRDEYYGSCQCEKCGQWYNMLGQLLLPPSEWEDNLENDY